MTPCNELGFYTLAGHSDSPRDLVDEVRRAEELGLGAAFVSERFNVKDAAVLSGAAGAVSERIGIATGATNHNTRHPLITATLATTMHRLTGGRFALGLGRGFDPLFKAIGLQPITSAQLEDVVSIYRRLWHGEMILGHDGPAGQYSYLHQDPHPGAGRPGRPTGRRCSPSCTATTGSTTWRWRRAPARRSATSARWTSSEAPLSSRSENGRWNDQIPTENSGSSGQVQAGVEGVGGQQLVGRVVHLGGDAVGDRVLGLRRAP